MLQQTDCTTNNKNRYTDRHLSNGDTQSRFKLLQTGIKAQLPNCTEISIQFTQIKLNNLNLKFPLSFLSLTSIIANDNRKIKNINKTIKKN